MMHKTLLAFVAAGLLAFGGAGVSAQTIDFETLVPGTSWQNPPNNPGDVVFSQDNIDMSVEEFLVLPAGSTFGAAVIVPPGDPFSPNGTQALSTNSINVKFDLSSLPNAAALVNIEYVQMGGNVNFQIDDTPLQNVPNLNAVVAPAGFRVVVSPTSILVELDGASAITSVLIGGQELGIDNVTVRTNEDPPPPPPPPPTSGYVYSVKFICGAAEAGPDQIPIVEPGFYATEINIHNYRPEGVDVGKEVITLVEQGEAVGREPAFAGVSGNDGIGLPPNTATMDDCVRIAEITGLDTSVLTIGYLVLRSAQEIKVDAVYTTTGFDAGVFPPQVDVERVEGDLL